MISSANWTERSGNLQIWTQIAHNTLRNMGTNPDDS